MSDQHLLSLNQSEAQERLCALERISELYSQGKIKKDNEGGSVNNHIHTTYSFSPYSPSAAVYMAWKNGLSTAGIMDHDSIGGAHEFIEAGKIMGIATTVGLECRVSMKGTRLEGKRINNPDQLSVAYVALHGISHKYIDYVNEYFAPFREKRNERNRKMCDRINSIFENTGIRLDFNSDVMPISNYGIGGSITERHILFALAIKLNERYPECDRLCSFLKDRLDMPLDDNILTKLKSGPEEYYLYDLLGVLKGNLVERFYIPAGEECPSVSDFIGLSKKVGAISAYAYLGDVENSVTGDKKAQRFEDGYIDLLFEELRSLGFNAVTYMPTRNTEKQLLQVMNYCKRYGFFEISGEDINSPRQSFICKALQNPMYHHLYDSTYALIGHEMSVSKCLTKGMLGSQTLESIPSLDQRVAHFAKIGRESL
ncbi:MAG: PHP domain-containing protein [Oscillospiraceae bacterium]|nr:PHP domain-containing protein [Oscillospiraceae bacterium]MDD4413346.1 PHP domain-containing protein [Oscillospiraceae bacterium]